jgi:hypothetical protein
MCEWGVQGLTLRLLYLGSAIWVNLVLWRVRRKLRDGPGVLFASTLMASMVTFVATSTFGDYMDSEWGFWVAALMVAHARLYTVADKRELEKPVAGRVLARAPAAAALTPMTARTRAVPSLAPPRGITEPNA